MLRKAGWFLLLFSFMLFFGKLTTAGISPANTHPSPNTNISTPAWPGYGHDPQHTGQSEYIGPTSPTLQWSVPISRGRVINFAPTIGADGTIFAGTWGDRQDGFFPGKLYAINPDGTVKWIYVPPAVEQHSDGDCCLWGTIEASVAVGNDGTLYFGRGDNKLYALNPDDGSLKWQFRTFPDGFPEQGGQVISSPVIGEDGTIYFGTVPSWPDEAMPALFAVTPQGIEKWRFETSGDIFGAPALGHDGTIYVGDRAGKLYALTDKGDSAQLNWTYNSLQADWYWSPLIGDNGTIYAPAADVTGFCRSFAKVIALTDMGNSFREDWIYTMPLSDTAGLAELHLALGTTNDIYFSAASINNNGPIPCGGLTDQGRLVALKDNGPGQEPTLQWSYNSPLGGGISGTAVGVNGTAYVAVRGELRDGVTGYVEALDPSNGNALWPVPVDAAGEIWWSPPAIGGNGSLYFGDAACADVLNQFPCEKMPALYAIGGERLSVYLPFLTK